MSDMEENLNQGTLPHFLVIGAQKCGTTSLIKNVDLHPDVYITKYFLEGHTFGEVFFFDFPPQWKKGLDWYKSLFMKGKICGEKTPNYIFKNQAMKRIHNVIPEVKLIVCLRCPVTRLISQLNMRRMNPKMKHLMISDILNNQEYIGRGFYYSQLKENVFKYFPVEQVKIIIMDEKYQLKINDESRKLACKGNRNKGEHGKVLLDESQHTKSIMDQVFDFLDLPRIDGEFNYYYVRTTTNLEVSDKEIKLLKGIYQEENEKLFQVLGREIKSWI